MAYESMNNGNEFFQEPAVLSNQYQDDGVLRSWLKARLPAEVLREVQPGLERLGARAAGDMLAMAADAEAHPPRHIPYDPWGRRVDRIEVTEGWKALHRVAAEEGIVATAYERAHGPWSRVHQFVRLYLYTPSSAICSCPLAMTDGAARAIELHGDANLKQQYLPHLLSRDPDNFWTSGQWMTERAGGSDVSDTSTLAFGEWRLPALWQQVVHLGHHLRTGAHPGAGRSTRCGWQAQPVLAWSCAMPRAISTIFA